MPAAAAAAVTPFLQKLAGKNHQPILEIKIGPFDECLRLSLVPDRFILGFAHRLQETPYYLRLPVSAIRLRHLLRVRETWQNR
jgi:hypothetical protein